MSFLLLYPNRNVYFINNKQNLNLFLYIGGLKIYSGLFCYFFYFNFFPVFFFLAIWISDIQIYINAAIEETLCEEVTASQ